MKNKERMLYQNNNLGYYLIIAFIAINTVYTIYILNAMDKDSGIGSFVMLTIGLLLLGFLMAIKVRIYSLIWCYIAVVIGIFQCTRILFTTNNFQGLAAFGLNAALIVSGILCLISGIVSANLTRIRSSLK